MSTDRRFAAEVSRILEGALAADDARRKLELGEKDFQNQVVAIARQFGWLIVHHGGNQHRKAWYDTTGFPDLLMIGPTGTILFRELKAGKGTITPHQQRWADELTGRHADYAVWRPADLPHIVAKLSDGRAVAQ